MLVMQSIRWAEVEDVPSKTQRRVRVTFQGGVDLEELEEEEEEVGKRVVGRRNDWASPGGSERCFALEHWPCDRLELEGWDVFVHIVDALRLID